MKKIVIIIGIISVLRVGAQDSNTMNDILKQYSFPIQTVVLDSVSVSYADVGKGESTLLFVHGLSSNLEAWKYNIETLSKSYRCIALDLPGFGRSGKNAAAYNASSFAITMRGLLDHLQLEKVVLVGHSMGGQASIKFAINYPNRVEKLVLIAPAGIETFTEQEGILIKNTMNPAIIKATTNEQIDKNYAANFYIMPKHAAAMITDRKNITKAIDFEQHTIAISKSIAGMIDDPVFEDLSKISSTTLVIFGTKDVLIPNRFFHANLSTQKVGELAVERIPNATLRMIENAGHFVQFEKPLLVNNAIEEFVKD